MAIAGCRRDPIIAPSTNNNPMKQIGGYMFFFGVGSIVLSFMQMEFILLSWISLWGEQVAWIIRIALMVVGGFLWLTGKKMEDRDQAPQQ
jgi:hypothetical protein